jgi:predicted AAA+ superfamily ATPase
MSNLFPVLTLTGPRQSGKTTLARAVFAEYDYVNLENLDERIAASEDPRGFLARYGRERGVIIDEAQKVPELFSYLQQVVDQSDEMGRFVLTGSQNFLLLEFISQSLAGRVAVNYLLPLSMRELQTGTDNNSPLNNIIHTGFFPAIYDRNIPAENYFPSYLQTYIERDVRSLKNIGNLNQFRLFLQLCAGRIGQMVNLSSIGAEVGIDAKTVRSWLSVLEASFIIFFLPPYFKNFNKRIVKQPKLYFYDTGVVCSLLGLNSASQVQEFYLRGNLFENFVIAEYRKMALHNGNIPKIYFWRDNTGNEIDLLVDQGTKLNAIEIKSGMTLNQSFFGGLKKFRKFSGINEKSCFLVYGGDQDMPRKDARVVQWRNIYKLPGLSE